MQLGRAIAAIAVVATHAIAHPFPGAPGLSHLLGRYGVTLFFVISGYIMVVTTGQGRFDRGAFLERRIKRIIPIYYVANLIMLTGRLVAPNFFKDAQFEAVHFVKSLLFIPEYQPNGSGLIFPSFRLGWTLNYEMFFYVCFALLAGAGMVTRNVVVTLGFTLLFVAGLIWPMSDAAGVFYTQVDLMGFVAGMWLGAMALKPRAPLKPVTLVGLFAVSLMIIGGIAALYATIRPHPLTQIMLILACAIHLRLLVALIDEARRDIPTVALLLGDASYSIYLFHMFGVGLSVAISKKLGGAFIYAFMPVSLAAGTAVGLVMYWFFERPIGRILHKYSLRPSRPLSSATQ